MNYNSFVRRFELQKEFLISSDHDDSSKKMGVIVLRAKQKFQSAEDDRHKSILNFTAAVKVESIYRQKGTAMVARDSEQFSTENIKTQFSCHGFKETVQISTRLVFHSKIPQSNPGAIFSD
jgi:hypothetical protein